MKIEWTCMVDGPNFLVDDDGNVEETMCVRQRGHVLQHEWWADNGSVRLTWWDDWKLGEGDWRHEAEG